MFVFLLTCMKHYLHTPKAVIFKIKNKRSCVRLDSNQS